MIISLFGVNLVIKLRWDPSDLEQYDLTSLVISRPTIGAMLGEYLFITECVIRSQLYQNMI